MNGRQLQRIYPPIHTANLQIILGKLMARNGRMTADCNILPLELVIKTFEMENSRHGMSWKRTIWLETIQSAGQERIAMREWAD